MAKTLFDMNTEMEQLLIDISGADGEITDEQIEQMDAMIAARGEKLNSYGHAIKKLNTRAKVRDAEARIYSDHAKALKTLAKADAASVESMLERVGFTMAQMNETELQTESHRFRLVNSTKKRAVSLSVADAEEVPEAYQMVVPAVAECVVFDMLKIETELKNGVKLEFAEIEPVHKKVNLK